MEFARLTIPAGLAKVSGLVGVVTASAGAVFGVITAESASGIMVAAGGFAVVVYGLYSGAREKRVVDTMQRLQKAQQDLWNTEEKYSQSQSENARLRGELDDLREANGELDAENIKLRKKLREVG